jgi:hypothetical protein
MSKFEEGELKGWQDAIESVRSSLRVYPDGGGDIEIMKEVERITTETVFKCAGAICHFCNPEHNVYKSRKPSKAMWSEILWRYVHYLDGNTPSGDYRIEWDCLASDIHKKFNGRRKEKL